LPDAFSNLEGEIQSNYNRPAISDIITRDGHSDPLQAETTKLTRL